MPLYMDFHKFASITIEDAKNAHTADEKIQKKYGVRFLQYWVNEKTGAVFCLVEGPDMQTVELVHQTAHGHVACAMVEVERGYYELIMGENGPDQWGLVRHGSGTVDLGYRNVIAVSIQCKPAKNQKKAAPATASQIRDIVLKIISKHDGRTVNAGGDDRVIGVFNDTKQAIQCAREVQTRLIPRVKDKKILFRIGLSTGQPLTEHDGFFEEAITLAQRLSYLAGENQVMVSSLVKELGGGEMKKQKTSMQSCNAGEESFLTPLFKLIETNLSDEKFNIDGLRREMGMSRPQLYRKIVALSGKAPNDLIRDLRLDKAYTLLKRGGENISETAFKVGFSHPSYFAKCFARKFGVTPSHFLKHFKG